jgi:hypothetical protein
MISSKAEAELACGKIDRREKHQNDEMRAAVQGFHAGGCARRALPSVANAARRASGIARVVDRVQSSLPLGKFSPPKNRSRYQAFELQMLDLRAPFLQIGITVSCFSFQ